MRCTAGCHRRCATCPLLAPWPVILFLVQPRYVKGPLAIIARRARRRRSPFLRRTDPAPRPRARRRELISSREINPAVRFNSTYRGSSKQRAGGNVKRVRVYKVPFGGDAARLLGFFGVPRSPSSASVIVVNDREAGQAAGRAADRDNESVDNEIIRRREDFSFDNSGDN